MMKQIALPFFGGPLRVEPHPSRSGPPLWIARVLFLREPRIAEETVIRDVRLRRGLNVIWAPPLSTRGENRLFDGRLTGHTAGKTTFCRLIRYLLGEERFSTSATQDRIRERLHDGWVVGEIVVQGERWIVGRPFALGHHPFAARGVGVEEALEKRGAYQEFLDALAGAMVSPIPVKTLPHAQKPLDWDLVLTWLTRDQEARFADLIDWRAPASESSSPNPTVADRHVVVKALLDLMSDEEREVQQKHEAMADEKRQLEGDGLLLRRRAEEDRRRLAELLGSPGEGEDAGPLFAARLHEHVGARRAALEREEGTLAELTAAAKKALEKVEPAAEECGARRQRLAEAEARLAEHRRLLELAAPSAVAGAPAMGPAGEPVSESVITPAGAPAGESAGEPGESAGEPGESAGEPGESAGEPGESAGEPGESAGEPGESAGESAGELMGEPGESAGELVITSAGERVGGDTKRDGSDARAMLRAAVPGLCSVPLALALARGCSLAAETQVVPADRLHARSANDNPRAPRGFLASLKREVTAARKALEEAKAAQRDLHARYVERNAAQEEARERHARERAAIEELERLNAYTEGAEKSVAANEASVARLTQGIQDMAERKAARRREHNVALGRLTERFSEVVQALLGRQVGGRVQLTDGQLKLHVADQGERDGAAISTLKVLSFDLASMTLGIEGYGYFPGFLIHDGPREADMDQRIYERLFLYATSLEESFAGRDAPGFQYIVTTTAPPPEKLQGPPWLVDMRLDASVPEGRLLKMDL